MTATHVWRPPSVAGPPARWHHHRIGRPSGVRRFGYLVAIGANVAMIYIVHHLLVWGWPPFLTTQFETLLPIITFSLLLSILVNVGLFFYDAGWFTSLTNIVTAGIGFLVALRTLDVFPFDFSTYATDWTPVARLAIFFVMVGTVIAIVVEAIQFLTWPFRSHEHDAGGSPDR